jgi:hypothetical protein
VIKRSLRSWLWRVPIAQDLLTAMAGMVLSIWRPNAIGTGSRDPSEQPQVFHAQVQVEPHLLACIGGELRLRA